jgi:hypothetical protein
MVLSSPAVLTRVLSRRTVDLAVPESESYQPVITQPNLVPPSPTNPIDLPPSHILSRLLDVYYQHAHPSYPLLPSRTTLDTTLKSPSGKSEICSALVLSICAYSGHLSISMDPASNALTGSGGPAGKIAADLWYEQARFSLSGLLKKGPSLELVQVSLLLSLRDYGKGNETQSWILSGECMQWPSRFVCMLMRCDRFGGADGFRHAPERRNQ